MILDENDNFLCAKRTSILSDAEIPKFSRANVAIENLNMPELMKEMKKYIKEKYLGITAKYPELFDLGLA